MKAEDKKRTAMQLTKLPEGGFIIMDGSDRLGHSPIVFASSKIEEALAFIKRELSQ